MSKYDMPMIDKTDTIPGKIMSRINSDSNVLEFGCATGRMTQYMKERLNCRVFIVEIEKSAYDIALQYAEDGYCGDIEQFEWVEKAGKRKFDYIIFADVLEHLKNPAKVIEKVADLLSEDGEIIVSVPNICHFDVLANLYLNRFKYTDIGLLDNTHIHFWGERDLQGFFEQKNFGITLLDAVYAPPYHTEQAVERGSLPEDAEEALLKKENCDLYQFFLVAKKKEWIEKNSTRLENRIVSSLLLLGNSVHLYWNMGDGYKAGECAVITPVRIKNGDTLVFRYENLPTGCKKVRFDPALGDFCTVENMSVISNRGALEFRALNGVLLGETFVFANTDPQMEIDLSDATCWIEIEAKIRKKRDSQSVYFYTMLQNIPGWKNAAEQMNTVKEELENTRRLLSGKNMEYEKSRSDLLKVMADLISANNTLADTRASLEKVNAYNLSLGKQINMKDKELEEIKTELEKERTESLLAHEEINSVRRALEGANEKARLLNELMNKKETELKEAIIATEAAKSETRSTERKLNKTEEELNGAKAEINALNNERNAQVGALNAVIEERGSAIAQLDAHIQHLRNELQQTVDYAHHMENLYNLKIEEYNRVATSQCWRMTYPIRRFLDLLKHCKPFMLIWKTMRSLKHNGIIATCKKIIKKIFRIKDKEQVAESIVEEPAAEPIEVETVEIIKPFTLLADKIENSDLVSETYAIHSMSEYDESEGKKILLVSHELDLTGAPVAIFHFAKTLKNAGYCPVVVSPHTGNLAKTFEEENIPTFVCPTIYESDAIKDFSDSFDLIVASTIVSAPIVDLFNGTNMPVFWWIHEAEASYTELFEGRMPRLLADNVFVKSGGKHAAKLLKKHRQYYTSEQMLYYVPDFTKEEKSDIAEDAFVLPSAAHGKKVFASVGVLEYRKGQDLAVDAILKLPKEALAKCYFIFVGKPYYFKEAYAKIKHLCQKYPENALYIEELPMGKIRQLYSQMDCLMCTSRDDPMPIVVTEALMLSKAVICSENTGSAALISQENAGIVYTDNSVEQLTQCILRVLHDDGIEELKANARNIYDKYFSEQVFKDNILSLMKFIFDKYDGQQKGKVEPIKIKSTSISSLIEAFEAKKEKEDYVALKEAILEWDTEEEKKTVLLVAQNLSFNSSTVALKYLAEELVKNGNRVAVLASSDGSQTKSFEALGVPVIVYDKLYQDDFLKTEAFKFDVIVLNSAATVSLAGKLSECRSAVYWWVHELNSGYDLTEMRRELSKIPQNVRILCDSEEVQKQILSCNSNCKSEIMRYAVPDKKKALRHLPACKLVSKGRKTVFLVVGQYEYRQILEAIKTLSEKEIRKASFVFACEENDTATIENIDKLSSTYPGSFSYVSNLSHDALFSVYKQCDCVIDTSSDIGASAFAIEAMMMSKPLICSDASGMHSFVKTRKCGLAYRNNKAEDISGMLRFVLNNKREAKKLGKNGRTVYVEQINDAAQVKKVENNIALTIKCKEKYEFNGTVSVVIPTYNAGASFETLLQKLLAQKKVRLIEIVAVDSGSTDKTVEYCKKYGVKLIEIPNKEFSHSYARNLGAKMAKGEVLILMTQDACPIDKYWVYEMIKPIISGEAVAVSCKEHSNPDIDLYYRCASENHAKFQGIFYEDKLNVFDSNDDPLTLRKKGSLNDVSCSIRRDVFSKYLYRFGYAEDLDMGIRLLKGGYAIKLINATSVVHGHNRNAGYYMKRGLVEVRAMDKIMEESKQPTEASEVIARKIALGTKMIAFLEKFNRAEIKEDCETEQFFAALEKNAHKVLIEDRALIWRTELPTSVDPLLHWCVGSIMPWAQGGFPGEEELFHHVVGYAMNMLKSFVKKENPISLDKKKQDSVYDCIEKQFCMMVGALLARADVNSVFYQSIASLAEGV